MKTKLDLMLESVQRGERELTFDVRDWEPAQVTKLETAVKAHGLDASSDGKWVLVRKPVSL